MAHAFITHCSNIATTQLKPEQLPLVEQFPVSFIAPSMQSIGFISGGDLVRGDEFRREPLPAFRCRSGPLEVVGVRLLEKPAVVSVTPAGVVVFNPEHPVPKRARGRAR